MPIRHNMERGEDELLGNESPGPSAQTLVTIEKVDARDRRAAHSLHDDRSSGGRLLFVTLSGG